MGHFDYSCAISGLSLRVERTVAIWVCEVEPGRWVPAALPLRGTYNRLGTIDGIEDTANSRTLARWFDIAVKLSKITLAGDAASELEYQQENELTELERALRIVERGTTMGIGDVRFEGRPLAHVLVHEGIYDAAVAAHPAVDKPATISSALPCPAGAFFYGSIAETDREELEAEADELLRFSTFFDGWTPVGSPGGPHYDRDTLEGYRSAYQRFAQVPWLIAALDRSARAVEDVPLSFSDLPAGWLTMSTHSWYGAVVGTERVAAATRDDLAHAIWKVCDDLDEYELRDLVTGAYAVRAFAIQRGALQPVLDVRDAIVLHDDDSERSATIDDGASWLALLDDDELSRSVAVNAERLAVLPELEPPVRTEGEALYTVPEGPRPDWLDLDDKGERYNPVLGHAIIDPGLDVSWYAATVEFAGAIPGKNTVVANSRGVLASQLRSLFETYGENRLPALRIDAFAVVGGQRHSSVDILDAIAITDTTTSRSARLSDLEAVEDIVTSPGARITASVDEHGLARLPELSEPLAAGAVYLRDDRGRLAYFGFAFTT